LNWTAKHILEIWARHCCSMLQSSTTTYNK
jgi:hypothetical protein